MQNLWTRAPRSQICNSCRRHLRRSMHSSSVRRSVTERWTTTTTTTTRTSRSSNGARSGKKKVGAAEIFTACYSTIMASAAMADASRKDARRRELDARLERAREELAQVLREASEADLQLAAAHTWRRRPNRKRKRQQNEVSSPSMFGVMEGMKAICDSRQDREQFAKAAEHREVRLSWVYRGFGQQRRWWSERLPRGTRLDEIDMALRAEENAAFEAAPFVSQLGPTAEQIPEREWQREPLTALQFSKVVQETNSLVDVLLQEAHRLEYPNDAEAMRRSYESLDSAPTAIRMMRSDGYPRYMMPHIDAEGTARTRSQVNATIREIFLEWHRTASAVTAQMPAEAQYVAETDLDNYSRSLQQWYRSRIKFWVAKLCTALLVAPAPPGIHNYNALMLGFTRVQQPTLSQLVVDSFLHYSRYRPSQQTIVCLLEHYREKGDIEGFYGTIRRLTALDGRGVQLRRRFVSEVYEIPSVASWARHHDVGYAANRVVQRAYTDVPLFDSVLTGLLSLGMVRHAIAVFVAFLADCQSISASTLNRVVNNVLDTLDGPAARLLVRGLVDHVEKLSPLLLRESRYGRGLLIKVRLVMAISTAPDVAFRNLRKLHVPSESVDNDDFITDKQIDNGDRLLDLLFVADAQHYLKRLDQVTTAAVRVFSSSSSSSTPIQIDDWLQAFDSLSNRSRQHHRQQQMYRRMARLRLVDEEVAAAIRQSNVIMELCLTQFVNMAMAETPSSWPEPYVVFLQKLQLQSPKKQAAKPDLEEENQLEEDNLMVDSPQDYLETTPIFPFDAPEADDMSEQQAATAIPVGPRLSLPRRLQSYKCALKVVRTSKNDKDIYVQLLDHYITSDVAAVNDKLQVRLLQMVRYALLAAAKHETHHRVVAGDMTQDDRAVYLRSAMAAWRRMPLDDLLQEIATNKQVGKSAGVLELVQRIKQRAVDFVATYPLGLFRRAPG